jgi:non-ribosomal peptide synthetase component F
LFVTEGPQWVSGTVEYAADVYERSSIGRLVRSVQLALEALVADAGQRVAEVSLLAECERQQVLVEWNRTERDYGESSGVHRLFERQAELSPDSIALVYEDEQLSYEGPNERANRLARYLMKLGVGAEVRVGLCLERGLEMVEGLLGSLKAGGAYVPLEPSQPAERLRLMLEDSQAVVALTEERLKGRLPAVWAQVVSVDGDRDEWSEESSANPETEMGEGNLAYVIYTSGSTGQPKGVMVTHRGLVNYLMWASEAYRVRECSGAVVHTSIGFDLTVTGLYLPLLCGGAVRLTEGSDAVGALSRAIEERDGERLVKLTPAQLKVVSGEMGREAPREFGKVLVIGG